MEMDTPRPPVMELGCVPHSRDGAWHAVELSTLSGE